jgi:SurA N-terminal domain
MRSRPLGFVAQDLVALGLVPWALFACAAPGSPPSPKPLASASPSGVDAPLPSPLPEIVARLDGEPIYLQQITPLVRSKLNRAKDPEKEKPVLMREALSEYLDRELLLREAMARGVRADTRRVEQLYDNARAEFTDEEQWRQSLQGRGFDPQSFKVELRVQQTVALFVARESHTEEAGATKEAVTQRAAAARALVERLRAGARIETYL